MIEWYVFPPDPKNTCTATHDTGGWTLTAHPATHPSNGAVCQAFDVPDGTPEANGCRLVITSGTRTLYDLHGVLYLHLAAGAGLVVDIFTTPTTVSLPRLVPNGQYLSQDVP